MDIEEVKQAKEMLNGSLLFAMSLGSRELYHSNVWKWLFDDKEIGLALLKKIFPDFTENSPIVKREQGNRDLSIWDSGEKKVWVIENKFKSLPYASQLSEYKAKLGEKYCNGVLICIKSPTWTVDGWRVITYADLMKHIEGALPKNHPKGGQIKEYVCIVRALLSLVSSFSEKHNNTWATLKDCVEYTDVSLDDICLKLNAEILKDKILSHADFRALNSDNSDWKLDVMTNFSHGESMICIAYRREDSESEKKNPDSVIGVEIQGDSYKKYVQLKCNAEDAYNKACEIGWLKQRCEAKKKGRAKDSRFNQYNQGAGYFFVYHADQLTPEKKRFDCLVPRILADIMVAKAKIKSL